MVHFNFNVVMFRCCYEYQSRLHWCHGSLGFRDKFGAGNHSTYIRGELTSRSRLFSQLWLWLLFICLSLTLQQLVKTLNNDFATAVVNSQFPTFLQTAMNNQFIFISTNQSKIDCHHHLSLLITHHAKTLTR